MKVENGILKRYVDEKKHFHFKTKSYMFDEHLLSQFKEWKELQIITKFGKVYSITKDDFDKYSVLNVDYSKKQIAINLKFLKVIKQNETIKMVAVFNETHEKIKENARISNLTITDYLANKFAI